jgi:hypothetical protein
MPLDWGPSDIITASQWWVSQLSFGLAAEIYQPESKILRVRYEDLVINTASELKRICIFLDIKFTEEMLAGGVFDTPEYTKLQHNKVGSQPCPESVFAWRGVLTTREKELFENRTAELLNLLGYDSDFGMSAKAPRRTERLKAMLSPLQESMDNIKQKIRRMKYLK